MVYRTRYMVIVYRHISGSDNITADQLSRVFNDQTEWMLDKHTFDSITKVFKTPEIDMFASRLNTQLANYVSWCPDPGALRLMLSLYHGNSIYNVCFLLSAC